MTPLASSNAASATSAANIAELATTVKRLLPELDAQEQRVAVTLYQLLAQGRPVNPKDAAMLLGMPLNQIEGMLSRWNPFVMPRRFPFGSPWHPRVSCTASR